MIDPDTFARRQSELHAEFARYVLDHPEIDEQLPEDAHIYFEVAGDEPFNEYSRSLAMRREREEGVKIVCIRVKGLAPKQGSRLLDPQITATPSVG